MMGLSTALSLCALLVSVFAVLAVGAVYARLRLLEHTALNARRTLFADGGVTVPPALRPRADQPATLLLQLNDGCSTCHDLWQTVTGYAATHTVEARIVGLFASPNVVESFPAAPGVERVVDADQWAALSEGYTPCVFQVDSAGQITDRRFVYRDTDVDAVLSQLAPAAEPARSNRAL